MNELNEGLEWSALEYEEKERSNDWFWALGIIVATSGATAFIYNNYFFAILLVLSGVLLWIFAKKKPSLISYGLDEKGLRVGDRIYLYENIKAFCVQTNSKDGVEKKPILFIRSERIFIPVIGVPIESLWSEKIRNVMLSKNIKEEEMREHLSEKIMETLGF